MRFGKHASESEIPTSVDGQDPRRSHPRHSTEAITCLLGEVVDISSSGIRIRCKGKPPFSEGALSSIKLAFKGGKLQVTVQERWRKRRGLFGYELGMMYVNNPGSTMAAIDSLVTFGFINPNAKVRPAGGNKQQDGSKQQRKTRPPIKASIDLPDYYATLELAPDADAQKIHDAYRKLARRYHPDANKAPDAEKKFIAVCEAYKVLSDEQQRKSYDMRQAG